MKNKSLPILIVNCIAISIYFYIVMLLGFEINFQTMFATNDSKTYLDVANWIGNGIQTDSLAIRPLFYPLFLFFTKSIGGLYGIWFFQFILWLLSINLLFISLKKITNSYLFSFIGTGVFLANLSIIAFTFHALTEILTVFLLSLFVYIFTHYRQQLLSFRFFQYTLLLFVLLTLTKPVFFLPLIGFLILVLPLFYLKTITNSKRNILITTLILLPLFFQIGLMKIKYNSFSVSTIGTKTLNEYIVTQCLEQKNKIERDSALVIVNTMSSDEINEFFYQNKKLFLHRFVQNLNDNIISAPVFLMAYIPTPNQQIINHVLDFNKWSYKLHRLEILLFLILILIYIRQKKYSLLIFISVLFTLNMYYLLATGISYYQGDRLVLPAISIWSFLYTFIIFEIYHLMKQLIINLNRTRNGEKQSN